MRIELAKIGWHFEQGSGLRPLLNDADANRLVDPRPAAVRFGNARRSPRYSHLRRLRRAKFRLYFRAMRYGPRLPFLVISPWAKDQLCRPYADRPDLEPALHRGELAAGAHRRKEATCRTGLLRPRRRQCDDMFDFDTKPNRRRVILDPLNGRVVSG
jgi:hypothetical protein